MAEASPAPAPGIPAKPVEAALAELELELFLVEDALIVVDFAEELMVEEGEGKAAVPVEPAEDLAADCPAPTPGMLE